MKIANMLFLCLLLAGAGTLSAQDLGKETRVDSVLASVNGDPITLLDVMLESSREELRLASLYSGARLYSEISQLRKKITEDIIIRKLIYAKYLEKPFPIDNQYIERMLDHLAVTLGGGSRDTMVKKAEAIGTTLSELKEKVQRQSAAIDNAFAFLEEAFGDGREIAVFAAELTGHGGTSKFIGTFGSDSYYAHNASVQIQTNRNRLLNLVESLEIDDVE